MMVKKGVKSIRSILFLFIVAVMLLLVTSIAGARTLLREDLAVKHIFLGDYGVVYPNENSLDGLIVFENLASKDLDNLRVSLTIDELDLFGRSELFDLDQVNDLNDHRRSVWVFADILNNVKAGEYTAKIVVENDDIKRIFYRPVWILR